MKVIYLKYFNKKSLLKIAIVIFFIFAIPITKGYSMYENDPERPIEELLDNIKTSSIQGSRSAQHGVSLSMFTFSALLVRLSNDASKTADKNLKLSNQNIKMQERLLKITYIVLGINILMFGAQMLKFFGLFNFSDK